MKIVEKNNIIINKEKLSKEAIIKKMIRNLKLDEIISENIYSEIMERESIENTSLGFKFAIPHSKSKYINEAKVIYLKSLEDIKWADEEEKINHIFMILVPYTNPEKHIDILKDISFKILNDEFKVNINKAKTEIEIEKILNS